MSERTRQHRLFILRQRPREHPLTPQQERFRQVLQECGVVKGISRDELIDKMKNCIKPAWEKLRGS